MLLTLPLSVKAVLAAQKPPNIIFILADDLGYGDCGAFGQKKIRTPNLDQMAAEGMKLTQHYSGNAVCAPSRCVLMTGKHPGHAFIRNNLEVEPEGQYPIPGDTVTLPKLLKKAGYATGAFGKWGLGPPESSGAPLKQGFDRFYGYNCQRAAHNYYPTSLWDNATRTVLPNPAFAAHQPFPAGADPGNPASYARFTGKVYSADVIAEQARQFVQGNKDRPFFLYWPATVPHLGLQVPEDSLREYLGSFPETPYIGSGSNLSYLPHYAPRAAYAAMITRFDREIGRMVDLVKQLGLEENTMFIFTSDNGPARDKTGGGVDTEFFESAGGLRGKKGSLYEGGFREATIVRWKGHIASGSSSDRVSGFEDWMPTLLDIIGRKGLIPFSIDGLSFAPTLLGQPQEPRPFLYREYSGAGGQQCVRMGDWKGYRQNLMAKAKAGQPGPKLELYNLKDDPAEQNNVAAQHPDIVKQIEQIMREQHLPSPEFPMPVLDQLARSSQ